MAEYARVENDKVLEIREIDSIPSHKAALWKTVERSGAGDLVSTQIDGNVVRVIRHDLPLDELKADLKRRVDDAAELRRLKYITGGAGKTMEYIEAREQAISVKAMGRDVANALPAYGAEDYPILAASVPWEAATLYDAAELVMARYEAFATVGGAIKSIVITAKKAISEASDAAAARAAYEAIEWTV